MRVFMLGWEFPPHVSGGLGTACYGMTYALAQKKTDVTFVLPRVKQNGDGMDTHLKLSSASGVVVPGFVTDTYRQSVHDIWEERLHIHELDAMLSPYATERSYVDQLLLRKREVSSRIEYTVQQSRDAAVHLEGGYGPDLMSEVFRYSQAAAALALRERFDVIHVHDWMTYPAGILIKKLTGKPLICHIHATEYDRSGYNVNQAVAAIERTGLEAADKVVAVSHYTRNLVMAQYGIPGDKIEVVHNAVNRHEAAGLYKAGPQRKKGKYVLFMGRVTFQKGPDYFIGAADMVLKTMPDVRFIMAGYGDMLNRMVRRAAQLRIGNRIHFTGFLRGPDVDRMYALSDLYVMPSVSEPFGIAPLEAMLYDVPVLISRQSGVSEVIKNALKVDFWDVREMANKICAVLRYPHLAAEMVRNCREELKGIRWENAATHLNKIYDGVCRSH
ncbi:MAG: glycosyltransferase [Deltaproteobacteria bacterium]|nr:glycosyltransferase [Deltaproteobacteria bacterium]